MKKKYICEIYFHIYTSGHSMSKKHRGNIVEALHFMDKEIAPETLNDFIWGMNHRSLHSGS
jgi:hypothetical protein